MDFFPKLFFPLLLLGTNVFPLRAAWEWQNDLAVATAATSGGYDATFTYANKGKESVTVENVVFACSCAEFRFRATPAKPGGTGTLTVHLAANGEVGPGKELELVATGPSGAAAEGLTIRIGKPGETP